MISKIKQLAGDTIIYGLASIIIRLLTFTLTPLYSNYLSTAQFDFLIFVFSFTTFLTVLYSFGMEGAFLRFFDKNDDVSSKKVFTTAYAFVNIVSLVFTVGIITFSGELVYFSGYSHIPEAQSLLVLAAFIPFLDVLTYIPFNYLRITQKPLKLSLIRLGVILVSLTIHFVLLTDYNFEAKGAIFAQIAANLLAFILLLPIIIQNLDLSFDDRKIIEMLRFAIPTIPAGLFIIILQVADRPLLKFLTNSDIDITTYQVNYRLGIPMLVFVSVFDFAWQPFYLKHHTENDSKRLFSRILTYYTFLAGSIFLLTIFFMEFFVRIPFPGGYLINPIYWKGLSILPLILIAYFFYGMYINFSIGVILEKKTIATSIALMIGVVVNIALNFILVPRLGYAGSAYSIMIAYLIAMVIIYFASSKFYKIDYEWFRILLIIISIAIIYFANSILSGLIENLYFSFLLKIFLFAAFLIILKLFGFFNKGEIAYINKFIKINQT